MNITKLNRKDLEIGDTCLIQVTVEAKEENSWVQFRTTGNSPAFVLADFEDATFYSFNHKYDPNRLFRKGDKVRLCEYNGRAPFDNENFEPEEAGQLCIIAEDEDDENAYSLHVWKLEDMEREPDAGERPWFAFPLMFMELVTPVEELGPYFIMELKGAYGVYNTRFQPETEVCHFFTDMHPNAKAAAEAERDRLNAEYRKAVGNDD